jgi:hypothetical protein
MASEKICTPEPEKYSMTPCMGRDLAGLQGSVTDTLPVSLLWLSIQSRIQSCPR